MSTAGAAPDRGANQPVTIVTQTRVRPEASARFATWQEGMGTLVEAQKGFLDHKVMPPSPPEQVDWVILQRFATTADAVAWMNSQARLSRVNEVSAWLVGNDDVHLVRDGQPGGFSAPVSAVISTQIKPGMEEAYRKWERRIAAAQSKAPGFQGYRFEPPIPGVQNDFVAIVRFDTEAHLEDWLASPERAELLSEAEPLTQEFHARTVRTGFEQWFPARTDGGKPPPAWKQNMLVLLMLYPVVVLFGLLISGPLLLGTLGMPFAVSLFIGNAFSIVLLNYLVPWVSGRFTWWLMPHSSAGRRLDIAGAALLVALYCTMILAFRLT